MAQSSKLKAERPKLKLSSLPAFQHQENIQFCGVSRGSLMELIDDLNVCVDEEYFSVDYIEELKVN